MVGLVAYPCVYNLLIKAVAPFPLRVFDFFGNFGLGDFFQRGDDVAPCFGADVLLKPIKSLAVDDDGYLLFDGIFHKAVVGRQHAVVALLLKV